MQHRQTAQKDRRGHRGRDSRHSRVTIEPREQRSRPGKRGREHDPGAGVDPEEITREPMIELRPLDDGLCDAVEPDVHQEQAERGDDRHQSKIRGCQQARQNHRRDHLDRERQRHGERRHARPADRDAAQAVAIGVETKSAVLVEWRHRVSTSRARRADLT